MSPPIEFPVEGVSNGEIRLRLRSDADVPAIIAAARDPEIPRWTRMPYDYDEDDAREFAEQSATATAEGTGLHLLVVDAESDRLLGTCGIVEIDWNEGRAELGYWLAREARGRGVITRAMILLSGWIFDTLPIERIQLGIEPENRASRAVAERAGFTFEGVLRSYFVNKGERRDAAMYSLIRGELPS